MEAITGQSSMNSNVNCIIFVVSTLVLIRAGAFLSFICGKCWKIVRLLKNDNDDSDDGQMTQRTAIIN